jgi:hypothetical protein
MNPDRAIGRGRQKGSVRRLSSSLKGMVGTAVTDSKSSRPYEYLSQFTLGFKQVFSLFLKASSTVLV